MRYFPFPNSETAPRAPLRRFLRTADGVTIDSVYEPCAAVYDASAPPSRDLAFVVAHGFTGDVDRPHVRRVARAFARYGAVVTFSFRGHGASGGRSTVGDREVLDLAAAVAWARELGHTRVATVGFSMGGSVVLRHAALHGSAAHEGRTETRTGGVAGMGRAVRTDEGAGTGRAARTREGARTDEAGGTDEAGRTDEAARTDAVVSVSAPARWHYRGTAPMRRLHWLVTQPVGRAVGRYGLRTRIHHRDWDPVPTSPVESVPLIAPTPLLIVHGDRDGYFPVDHPRMLAAAAGEHGELWLEPGMGHAEHATDDALLGRIAGWAAANAASRPRPIA